MNEEERTKIAKMLINVPLDIQEAIARALIKAQHDRAVGLVSRLLLEMQREGLTVIKIPE